MRPTIMNATAINATIAVALAVSISACTQKAARGPGVSTGVAASAPIEAGPVTTAVAPAPGASLNGRWVPTDASARKVYYAQFRNGSFASRDPGSGAALARGTYKAGSDSVSITYSSSTRKQTVKVDCKLQGENTMNCKSSTGGSFVLKRA